MQDYRNGWLIIGSALISALLWPYHPTNTLLTGMCTVVTSRQSLQFLISAEGRRTQLDEVANRAHYQKPHAHCLRDLDEFSSVGCWRCVSTVTARSHEGGRSEGVFQAQPLQHHVPSTQSHFRKASGIPGLEFLYSLEPEAISVCASKKTVLLRKGQKDL